jgi:hypothetical protein
MHHYFWQAVVERPHISEATGAIAQHDMRQAIGRMLKENVWQTVAIEVGERIIRWRPRRREGRGRVKLPMSSSCEYDTGSINISECHDIQCA